MHEQSRMNNYFNTLRTRLTSRVYDRFKSKLFLAFQPTVTTTEKEITGADHDMRRPRPRRKDIGFHHINPAFNAAPRIGGYANTGGIRHRSF